MRNCPCRISGHLCIACEQEMIEEIEKAVEQCFLLGYLNRDLFNRVYKEVKE